MRNLGTTALLAMAVAWAMACGGTDKPGDDLAGNDPGPGDVTDPGNDGTPVDPGADGRPDLGPDGVEDPGTDGTGTDDGPKPDVAGDTPTDGTPVDTGHDVPPPPCQAQGDPCDDGDPCTHGETCSAALACAGGTPYACDDGRSCTDDTCDGQGNCRYTVKKDACLVRGICRAGGDVDPENPCAACDPATPGDWTPSADGAECDPAGALDACHLAPLGQCTDGACVPQNVVSNDCDDQNPCTQDRCDLPGGCTHTPVTGVACVLADPCKLGACNQGKCIVPAGATCDDGNDCTLDECKPEEGGCLHTVLSDIACNDDDACTVEDTCFEGACRGLVLNCDDGNICTQDGCDGITGCWHDITDNACCVGGVSKCDDANPCTNDECTADGLGCLNTPNTAACNDKDPCTVNDSCSDGFCAGVSKNCNDGNPCTLDRCEAGKCLHTAQDGVACDDGLECSVGDHCVAGQCIADTTPCVCKPTFSPVVSKFVTMLIPDNGQAGNGANLDEDAGTCAPADNCCCGVDNALGPVAGLPVAADAIKKAVDEGQIILLFEHRNFRADGGAYTLAFYTGKLDASNPTCDFKTQTCKYTVDKSIFDEECNPLVFLDNAKIVGTKLTAGGKNYRFPFDLPLAGINLHVDLYFARVDATVTVSGGKVAAMTGVLGGAVPKQQIIDAITAIPDDQWPPTIPVDKATILSLIDILVTPDIDGDGDGIAESASLGIKFSAIGGTISGVF